MRRPVPGRSGPAREAVTGSPSGPGSNLVILPWDVHLRVCTGQLNVS